MTDLIIGKNNVTAFLREQYFKLGKDWINLLEIPMDNHLEVTTEALKILINEQGYECVYVTLSKPAPELEKLFKSKGVDTSKLSFVDAISRMYGVKQVPSKKYNYTSGPIDIDSITIALKSLLASLNQEKKLIFLDSITTVLLYNSLPKTIRFSQFLTQTLKKIGVDGVLVSVAKGLTNERLVQEISKLCDKAISIESGRRGGQSYQ